MLVSKETYLPAGSILSQVEKNARSLCTAKLHVTGNIKRNAGNVLLYGVEMILGTMQVFFVSNKENEANVSIGERRVYLTPLIFADD